MALRVMMPARPDGFGRDFSCAMSRCMRREDALVGVMGLDKPPPELKGRNLCADHYVRAVRLKVDSYAPAVMTINRKVQHVFDALTREGISLGILRRGIRKHSPSRKAMQQAMSAHDAAERYQAWLQCSQSWGIKAANHAIAHSLEYGPRGIVMVLTLRDAMYALIGRQMSPDAARQAIRKAYMVLHPNRDGYALKGVVGHQELKGRRRICAALMKLDILLREPIYQQVLFHPEIEQWGQFSWTGAVLAAALGICLLAWLSACGVVGCTIFFATLMALMTNEARLWFRDAWLDERRPSGGVKAWLLASQYTGRVRMFGNGQA